MRHFQSGHNEAHSSTLANFLLLCSFCYSIQSNYTSIFSFGDSYTDTSNLAILCGGPASTDFLISKPPYGMTSLGTPPAAPLTADWPSISSLKRWGSLSSRHCWQANQSFKQGVNFAVGGATALNQTFYVDRGFQDCFSVTYLHQLPARMVRCREAFALQLNPSFRSDANVHVLTDCTRVLPSFVECKEYFAKALFFVGELGWNDYGAMLLAGGTSVDAMRSHVPEIIESICAATEKIINESGKTVVVSGLTPMGCAPSILALMANQTGGGELEPDTGCLKDLNLLSKEHNQQLRRALTRLGGRHPGARVIYADLYAPVIDVAVSPERYGFNGTDGVLRACCGGGASKYGFDLTALCGMPGVSAGDPSTHTQAVWIATQSTPFSCREQHILRVLFHGCLLIASSTALKARPLIGSFERTSPGHPIQWDYGIIKNSKMAMLIFNL
ncbi:hypothetical protein EJB05_32594, partial [Eragrostis curvula]